MGTPGLGCPGIAPPGAAALHGHEFLVARGRRGKALPGCGPYGRD